VAETQAPTLTGGLVLANPKAFAAIGAVYAAHGAAGLDDPLRIAASMATLSMVILVVNTAWLAFGSGFASILTHPKLGRAANVVFAVLLLMSVGLALASMPRP